MVYPEDDCISELVGIVLAGGKSKRLGRDKARVRFAGQDLLSRAVRQLQRFVSNVWVVGRDPRSHGLDVPWMFDAQPGLGPVGGILTALERLNRPLLVISCDLPLLDDGSVKQLIESRCQRPSHALMTTWLQVETGYIEALVSVYEPESAKLMEQALTSGVHKLSVIIPPDVRHHIPYSTRDAKPFFNINYPADLRVMQELDTANAPF